VLIPSANGIRNPRIENPLGVAMATLSRAECAPMRGIF
jgi:hypothetical protein